MAAEIASAARRPPSLTVQAGWLLTAKLIGFAFSIAAPLIIVRILSQQEFGLYKQAFLVVTAALNFLPLAFYMNVFYFLPRRPAAGPKIVLNVLIVHGVAGISGDGCSVCCTPKSWTSCSEPASSCAMRL